jgi:Uma2 family endonuclease
MVQISSPIPVTLPLSLEDFLALPETKPPREFVEGTILEKPMPQGKHSALQSKLVPMINNALRGRKIARAFAELRCTFGGCSLVPDVSVFFYLLPEPGVGNSRPARKPFTRTPLCSVLAVNSRGAFCLPGEIT